MKKCPTCNRTFEDTFTFCLKDGAVLDSPIDPNATLLITEPKVPIEANELHTNIHPFLSYMNSRTNRFYLTVFAVLLLLFVIVGGGYWLFRGAPSRSESNSYETGSSSNVSTSPNQSQRNSDVSSTSLHASDYFKRGTDCDKNKDYKCAILNFITAAFIRMRPRNRNA